MHENISSLKRHCIHITFPVFIRYFRSSKSNVVQLLKNLLNYFICVFCNDNRRSKKVRERERGNVICFQIVSHVRKWNVIGPQVESTPYQGQSGNTSFSETRFRCTALYTYAGSHSVSDCLLTLIAQVFSFWDLLLFLLHGC